MHKPPSAYDVEPTTQTQGRCDCCGCENRTFVGWVHRATGETAAAYFVYFSPEHLAEAGASLDFIIGAWGDDSRAADRMAVSLLYREQEHGPELMVVDATDRPVAASDLVGHALTRAEVIGTPLAPIVFDIVDAIFLQDPRL